MEFRGLKPIPIPVTQDGIDIEKLKKQKKIKGVLVTPCHQYPLGYVSSAENNEKLLAWAKTEGAWIIEDDYDSELRYSELLGVAYTQIRNPDSNLSLLGRS